VVDVAVGVRCFVFVGVTEGKGVADSIAIGSDEVGDWIIGIVGDNAGVLLAGKATGVPLA
jgi:hypothetical protein